jgi:AcrR family transcriptional regulator
MAKRGRREEGSADAREAVLRAARALFANRGLHGTSLRAIAARARVDVALVPYYFGTKDELFASAIELPAVVDGLRDLVAGPGPGRGTRLVRFYLEQVFSKQNQPAICAILRTVVSTAGDLARLRIMLRRNLSEAAATVLQGRDRMLRAQLLGAQLTGLFISRHLVRAEPLASASIGKLASLMGPSVEVLLGPPQTVSRRH